VRSRPQRGLVIDESYRTYYAYAIDKNFTFTADYQLITNPAYNADRGPVSIFSGRLHGEF
jgi:high affinity Mn2+ porin